MSTRTTTIRSQRAARNGLRRKSGFTVLEVLVAMFILLVGGLAILNIFPPALGVIRGSENREIAISMSQSKLDTYANEPATIPDAIYNGDNATGAFVDANVAVAGTRTRNFSLPKDNTPAAFAASGLSDQNNAGFRRVVGERHRVLDAPIGYVPTGKFVLANFSAIVPVSGQPNTFPRFYIEENIVGVVTDRFGVLNFQNARLESDETQMLSDATTPSQLATFWQNADFLYYVSYRYLNGTEVNGVDEEKIVMTTASPQVFQGRTAPAPARQIVAGEIAMRVRLPLIGNFPTVSPERSAVGFLSLPGGVGAQDALSRPINPGDVVSVDYTVSDWRQLIYDSSVDVPSSKVRTPALPVTARDIKLPIPTLNTIAAVVPIPLYGMLFSKTNNGLQPQSPVGNWSGTPNASGLDPVLDVDAASATLNVGTVSDPQARISYRTSRDWAQQISVAAKTYYRFDRQKQLVYPNEVEAWREYWSRNQSLYFHASEAGKTVLVTFKNGTNTVANQVVPIGRDLQTPPIDPLFVGFVTAPATRVAVAVLTDQAGNSITPSAILSVRGASIRSRTAWIEGKNYVQEIKEDYRPLTD